MKSTLKWSLVGGAVFLALGFGTHWDVALCLAGAPLFGVGLGWCFEKLFPHAYDSIVKEKDSSSS